LNCWVKGDELGHVFPVKIARIESVGELRKKIKEEKRPQFDDIPADHLVLYTVSVHLDDLETRLPNLDLKAETPLSPGDELANVFQKVPDRKYLYIIVQRPESNGTGLSPVSPALPQLTGADVSLCHRLTDVAYVGCTVSALHQHILANEKLFRRGTYYAKFFSIVQSSGTGKTKALLSVSLQ
jgi:hypothetical protein